MGELRRSLSGIVPTASDSDHDRAMTVAEQPHGARTILVADDDDAVRSLVALFLRNAGHTVLEASNGQEALAQIDESVELVIADLVMPPAGGLELADALKALSPKLKIIFMSGYGTKLPPGGEDRDPLLVKPFGPDELLRRVEQL